MSALKPLPDLSKFLEQVRAAPRRVLILDYDGTLAPFHIDPADARPYPGVENWIDTLMEDPHTRLLVVTGRWVKTVPPLLNLHRMPEIWGSHGREYVAPNGEYTLLTTEEKAQSALTEVETWAQEFHEKGGWCEIKPGAFAIHWRGLRPEQASELRRTMSKKFMAHPLRQNLEWHDFDGGIELRAPGCNKGNVVSTVLAQERDAVAAYLGDDFTDESAFAAIKNRGLSVLVRPQFRPTRADVWLRPPFELFGFFEQWHHAAQNGAR
jgi:trehalose 6-phosphate phosphatase